MGAELVVPTSRQAVLALDSRALYGLEQAGEIARAILDERIVTWTEQSWSQREIAQEIGCSSAAVSKRQARLGVKSADRRGGDRFANPVSKNGGVDCEVVDGEVVDAPAPRRKREREPQLEDWLLDMLPGAEPEGAFRQAVKAWCDQERSVRSAMDGTGIALVPKSDRDREALLDRLDEIHTTAARLERQLRDGR